MKSDAERAEELTKILENSPYHYYSESKDVFVLIKTMNPEHAKNAIKKRIREWLETGDFYSPVWASEQNQNLYERALWGVEDESEIFVP